MDETDLRHLRRSLGCGWMDCPQQSGRAASGCIREEGPPTEAGLALHWPFHLSPQSWCHRKLHRSTDRSESTLTSGTSLNGIRFRPASKSDGRARAVDAAYLARLGPHDMSALVPMLRE